MNEKEKTDKLLLLIEVITGIVILVMFLIIVMMATYLEMKESTRLLIIIPTTILVVIECFVLLKIEQVAGYYECRKCNHRYIPSYKNVNLAPHIGRTRYLKCPKCNKKSWNKKVLTK